MTPDDLFALLIREAVDLGAVRLEWVQWADHALAGFETSPPMLGTLDVYEDGSGVTVHFDCTCVRCEARRYDARIRAARRR